MLLQAFVYGLLHRAPVEWHIVAHITRPHPIPSGKELTPWMPPALLPAAAMHPSCSPAVVGTCAAVPCLSTPGAELLLLLLLLPMDGLMQPVSRPGIQALCFTLV